MAGHIETLTRGGKKAYRVRYERPSAGGGRDRMSRTVPTKREADAILKRWRQDEAEGKLTVRSRMTVGEIAREWLDLTRPRLRPKTAVDYAASVRLIEEALGALKIQDVTPIQVQQQYRAWTDAGVGARSIELAHLRLRQMLDLAVAWKIIRDNPVKVVQPPRCKPKERRVWTEAEARQFIERTEGARYHLLWSLVLATGLRRGEALGLRWQDLDLDVGAPVLRVRQTVELVGGRVRTGEPKSDAAKRVVDIDDGLRHLIVQEQALARDRARFQPERFDLIFCTHDGGPLNPNNVYRQFQLDIARAGVPRITLHDLRRTFATIASSRGVPIRELAAILGHSKPSVTLDVYAQGTRAGGREAVGRVGRALFG
jgi:integrase